MTTNILTEAIALLRKANYTDDTIISMFDTAMRDDALITFTPIDHGYAKPVTSGPIVSGIEQLRQRLHAATPVATGRSTSGPRQPLGSGVHIDRINELMDRYGDQMNDKQRNLLKGIRDFAATKKLSDAQIACINNIALSVGAV
jgi:hypothetical protein